MANCGVQRLSSSYRLSRLLPLCFVSALSLLFLCSGVKGQSAERGKDERGKGGQRRDEQGADELRKLNESAAALIKRVSPSVVQILVTGYGPLEEGEKGSTSSVIGRQRAIDSGFVADSSGCTIADARRGSGTA